eukprot:1538870-Rhodomonas_salina.2
MGFYLAFGAQLEEFSTSFMSLTTLFEAILGDFDFDAMYQVRSSASSVFSVLDCGFRVQGFQVPLSSRAG